MGRKPRTTTTEGAETPAVELTARQIARRAAKVAAENDAADLRRLAEFIEPAVDDDGGIYLVKPGTVTDNSETTITNLARIYVPLDFAVKQIKKEKADAETATRTQLALLLESEEGKKIAAELLAAQSPIDPRD